jgi:hypothetical protein
MNLNDVLFCGLIWAQFRRVEAGLQLLDAAESSDPELKSLAEAMLDQAGLCSDELLSEAVQSQKDSPLEFQLIAYTPGNISSSAPTDFWWLPTTNA